MTIKNETPNNIEELKKMANNKNNWELRLSAVHQLKYYDCQQSRDIITRLTLTDKVFKVKEEALRASQGLKINKNGKPLFLGKKDIGYKTKDFTKVFQRVKREGKIEEFDINIFKEKFKQINPEMYDVMRFEKSKITFDNHKVESIDESGFNRWIENTYKGLPKK